MTFYCPISFYNEPKYKKEIFRLNFVIDSKNKELKDLNTPFNYKRKFGNSKDYLRDYIPSYQEYNILIKENKILKAEMEDIRNNRFIGDEYVSKAKYDELSNKYNSLFFLNNSLKNVNNDSDNVRDDYKKLSVKYENLQLDYDNTLKNYQTLHNQYVELNRNCVGREVYGKLLKEFNDINENYVRSENYLLNLCAILEKYNIRLSKIVDNKDKVTVRNLIKYYLDDKKKYDI